MHNTFPFTEEISADGKRDPVWRNVGHASLLQKNVLIKRVKSRSIIFERQDNLLHRHFHNDLLETISHSTRVFQQIVIGEY